MPRNGSGSYAPPTGNPVVDGTTIDPSVHNTTINDIGAEITNSVPRDGQAAMTGALDMGNQRIKNVANGTLRTDALSLGQAQDGGFQYVATVAGTANAITLTPSPAIAAYTAGQGFSFKTGASANTSSVTVAISGLSAKAITKRGTTALVSGDLPANTLVFIQYDGTQFQVDRVADMATKTGTETLTNKTLTSPTLNSPTINSPTITSLSAADPTFTGTATIAAISGNAIATQAQMEAGSASTVVVTPARQKHHPAHPKAWALVTFSGGNPSLVANHGISSISDAGVGVTTLNFTTAFSSTSYGVQITTQESGTTICNATNKTTSSCDVRTLGEYSGSWPTADRSFFAAFYGDQ